jgi:hypothetical protein
VFLLLQKESNFRVAPNKTTRGAEHAPSTEDDRNDDAHMRRAHGRRAACVVHIATAVATIAVDGKGYSIKRSK